LAIALFVGGSSSVAAAATGDVRWLTDFNTASAPRPNTYDVDVSDIIQAEMMIVPMRDNGTPVCELSWFMSKADAESVVWSHTTTAMNNADFSSATFVGMEYGGTGSGMWYLAAVDLYVGGADIGPDSWRGTYTNSGVTATGDFSFVCTDFSNPDSGTVDDAQIEYYDPADPTFQSSFAKAAMDVVNGFDDDANPIFGLIGRSYPTALDAIAQSMQATTPYGINIYAKYPGSQVLFSVTDRQNVLHEAHDYDPNQPAIPVTGWAYGVYYSPDGGTTWNRAPYCFEIAADDYVLEDGALVIWQLMKEGCATFNEDVYNDAFPKTFTR
jgi:hypothetical protein